MDLTFNTFNEIGFGENEIVKEPFKFSDFYSTTLIKLLMTMALTTILILVLFVYTYPLVSLIIILGMIFVVFFIIRGLKHPERGDFFGEYFGTTIESTNVFVKIPAKSLPEKEAGDIIISAHLDSKSQSFKTMTRVILYKIWLYSGIVLGFFYIPYLLYQLRYVRIGVVELELGNTGLRIFDLAIWISCALISFVNVSLMFLNTHNKSPGALDNASGMAIVFELSSFFEEGIENFNLWFCQFSAEELGTMGSRVFVNNHEEQFEKGMIFQINLDMISLAGHRKNQVEYLKTYGVLPRKQAAPLLGKYLDKAAIEENLKIKGFHLSTGAHTDCVPFHLRGYDSVVLSTRAAASYTHIKKDSLDKVDPQVLLDASIIVKRTILLLDNDYKTLLDNN